MFFTVELELFEPDDLIVEVEGYYSPADPGTDASDWDAQDYWEITKYTVFSNGKEIELELDDRFVYHKVREKLREMEIKAIGGFY